MGVRNAKLGGTDMGAEAATSADFNDTFDATISKFAVLSAQQAYQIMVQSGTFTNEDFLFADNFTDSDGVNDTVNTGTTTATFDTNLYELVGEFQQTTENDVSLVGQDNFTAASSTFTPTSNIDVDGITLKVAKVGTPANNLVLKIYAADGSGLPTGSVLATSTNSFAAGALTTTLTAKKFTFSSYSLTASTQYCIVAVQDTENLSGGQYFTISNQNTGITGETLGKEDSGWSQDHADGQFYFIIDSGTYSSSNIVVCDANLQALDGTEDAICVYAKHDEFVQTNAGDGSNVADSHGETLTVRTGRTDFCGIQFKVTNDCVLKSAIKGSNSTATTCYLYKGQTFSTAELLESVAYSTNTATFTKDLVLKANTYYWLVGNATGTFSTDAKTSGVTYPITGTNLNYTNSLDDGAEYTDRANEIATINTEDLSGAATNITNITVDISDGTTTLSAQALNTAIDVSSLSAGDLKLTFNESTTDTDFTPKMYGYGGNILK